MNLTNVNGNLMNPESAVGRSSQLRGVIFALLLKATHATNSSSTEAHSESDNFPVRTHDLVIGGLVFFSTLVCAAHGYCTSIDNDDDGLGSQRGRSDQGRTRRPCNNGEDNRSSIEATCRQVDVVDAECVEAIPVNTDDIPVARILENSSLESIL